MAFTITRDNYLTVNGIPLSTPAFWITDLTPTMVSGPTLKGGSLDLPASTGALAFPRRIAATIKQFTIVIVGTRDSNNGVHSNIHTGFITNAEELTAGLGIASASGDGTVTAVWTRPNASTKSASVTIHRFEVGELNEDKRNGLAVLELEIPLGVFA